MFVTKLRHIFGMLVSYINIGLVIVSASGISYIYVCNVSHIQLKTLACICTVKCRYNAVQFITVLQTELRKHWHKVNQILESQETPHISSLRARYGVPIVRILETIDRVITAPRSMPCCITFRVYPTCIITMYHERSIYLKKRIITWRSVTFCGAKNISLYISSCIYVAMYVVPFRNPLYFIS